MSLFNATLNHFRNSRKLMAMPVKWFGTHEEYNKIDVTIVDFKWRK